MSFLGISAAEVSGSPAPHAHAASEVLLDTLTIDATSSSSAQIGAVTLRQGTQYRVEVDGTMTVSGPLREDALYCYGSSTGDHTCDTPSHQPVSPTGVGLFAGTRTPLTSLSTRLDSFMSAGA